MSKRKTLGELAAAYSSYWQLKYRHAVSFGPALYDAYKAGYRAAMRDKRRK